MVRLCKRCKRVKARAKNKHYCGICYGVVTRQSDKKRLLKQNEKRRRENRKGKICKICKKDMSNIIKKGVRFYCSDKCAKEAMRRQTKDNYWSNVNRSRDRNARSQYNQRYGICKTWQNFTEYDKERYRKLKEVVGIR